MFMLGEFTNFCANQFIIGLRIFLTALFLYLPFGDSMVLANGTLLLEPGILKETVQIAIPVTIKEENKAKLV